MREKTWRSLLSPHQHCYAGDGGEAEAAGHACFRICLDFGITFAGHFFPFAGGLFDFDAGNGGFQHQPDDGRMRGGWFGQAGKAVDHLPAIGQSPIGDFILGHDFAAYTECMLAVEIDQIGRHRMQTLRRIFAR